MYVTRLFNNALVKDSVYRPVKEFKQVGNFAILKRSESLISPIRFNFCLDFIGFIFERGMGVNYILSVRNKHDATGLLYTKKLVSK